MSENTMNATTNNTEKKIGEVLRFVRLVGLAGADDFFDSLRKGLSPERADPLIAAVKEMAKICYNESDNPTEYHLNCIHSGTTKYTTMLELTDKEFPDDDYDDTYDTEEEAQAAIDKAIADGYATSGMVIDFDPDEWWAVLDKNNHNVFRMLFPSNRRALAFLYEKAKPEAYQKYLESGHVVTGSELVASIAKEVE